MRSRLSNRSIRESSVAALCDLCATCMHVVRFNFHITTRYYPTRRLVWFVASNLMLRYVHASYRRIKHAHSRWFWDDLCGCNPWGDSDVGSDEPSVACICWFHFGGATGVELIWTKIQTTGQSEGTYPWIQFPRCRGAMANPKNLPTYLRRHSACLSLHAFRVF